MRAALVAQQQRRHATRLVRARGRARVRARVRARARARARG